MISLCTPKIIGYNQASTADKVLNLTAHLAFVGTNVLDGYCKQKGIAIPGALEKTVELAPMVLNGGMTFIAKSLDFAERRNAYFARKMDALKSACESFPKGEVNTDEVLAQNRKRVMSDANFTAGAYTLADTLFMTAVGAVESYGGHYLGRAIGLVF